MGTTGTKPETPVKDRNAEYRGPSGPRIRCPLCGWQPTEHDLWTCWCGHQWRTFDTGGVCPGCLKQWPATQCFACHRWSPHSEWYEY